MSIPSVPSACDFHEREGLPCPCTAIQRAVRLVDKPVAGRCPNCEFVFIWDCGEVGSGRSVRAARCPVCVDVALVRVNRRKKALDHQVQIRDPDFAG